MTTYRDMFPLAGDLAVLLELDMLDLDMLTCRASPTD